MSTRVPGLFITGTDTDVGKTYVGAMIARALAAAGHRVGVYKPAASGCRSEQGRLISDDAVALWEAAGRPGDLDHVCPQRFAAPLAPHLAAQAEGKQLDPDRLRRGLEYWLDRSDIVLVEGAGGLMSPLGDEEYVADLANEFRFPLVVVARNVLGTLNQTLQTLIVAQCFQARSHFVNAQVPPLTKCIPCSIAPEGLPVAGVVLNHCSPPARDDLSLASNRRELAARCVVPILAEVAWGATCFDTPIDWFALAKMMEG